MCPIRAFVSIGASRGASGESLASSASICSSGTARAAAASASGLAPPQQKSMRWARNTAVAPGSKVAISATVRSAYPMIPPLSDLGSLGLKVGGALDAQQGRQGEVAVPTTLA